MFTRKHEKMSVAETRCAVRDPMASTTGICGEVGIGGGDSGQRWMGKKWGRERLRKGDRKDIPKS